MPVVKWIPLFLLATALPLSAAGEDSGSAALAFLQTVKDRKIDLSGKATALSAATTEDRKKEISRALDRLGKDLAEGTLELGMVKEDGDLSGVMVRKAGGFTAGSMQVYAIGLVKRAGEWKPAPVEASFDNTGIGYDTATTARAAALEDWMLRQRVLELQALRRDANQRNRKLIEQSLPRTKLAGMKPHEVGIGFLDACAKQDLSAMLGYLGGLNETLPDDWAERLKAATRATSGKPASPTWRLLMAPEVFRLFMQSEDASDEGLVSFACLDPSGKSATFRFLHLPISQSAEGLWQINLPAVFYDPDEKEQTEEDLDEQLLGELPGKITKRYPTNRAASAAEARDRLIAALKSKDMGELFPLLALPKDADQAQKDLTTAMGIWAGLQDSSTVGYPLPLAFHEEGGEAAVIVQFFSTREPERTDLQTLYFHKDGNGWRWTPLPEGPEPNNDATKLVAWVKAQGAEPAKNWQAQLLANSVEVKTVTENQAAPEEAAREVVQAWNAAMKSGDVEKALSLVAWVADGRGGSRMLRNLGPEIAAGRKSGAAQEIVQTYHSAHWSAVGVKVSSNDNPGVYPLYPVIQTEKGPRILLEIDLFASAARGRDFLNRAALERLQGIASPTLSEELGKMLEEYKKAVVK